MNFTYGLDAVVGVVMNKNLTQEFYLLEVITPDKSNRYKKLSLIKSRSFIGIPEQAGGIANKDIIAKTFD